MPQRRRRPSRSTRTNVGGGGAGSKSRSTALGDLRCPVYLTEHECRALVCALYNHLTIAEPLYADAADAALTPEAWLNELVGVAALQSRLTMPWVPYPLPDGWAEQWAGRGAIRVPVYGATEAPPTAANPEDTRGVTL